MVRSDIYKSTTVPVNKGSDGLGEDYYHSGGQSRGYLNKFSGRSCCPGRKKRLQYLVLFFSLFSVVCGLVLLGVGCGSGSTGFLAGLFLFLLLVTVGGILFVFYLRAIGRLNLPCWPSRAARISRTLLPSSATGDPAYVAVSSSSGGGAKRSSTELTLAESQIGTASMQQQLEQQQQAERSKLIEESDTAEAEKIDGSGPRIVLNMES